MSGGEVAFTEGRPFRSPRQVAKEKPRQPGRDDLATRTDGQRCEMPHCPDYPNAPALPGRWVCVACSKMLELSARRIRKSNRG